VFCLAAIVTQSSATPAVNSAPISTASSVAAEWMWHATAEAGSYLTCSLLPDFAHGFWSRQAYPQTPFELTSILADGAETYRVKQVHGDRVVASDELVAVVSNDGAEFVDADGIWGTQAGRALWTCTADCTPVLVGDRRTGAASAIHAGWRGTAAMIVPKAIAQLEAQGSQREDLRIALGPAIDGAVYQVSEAVAWDVVKTLWGDIDGNNSDQSDQAVEIRTILDRIGLADRNHPESPLYSDDEPGKVRLDVRRVIVGQLRQLGIAAEAIAVAPHCTFQDADRFFSYRRTGEKFVQWSGIVTGLRSD
jgi:YfiH family protein